MICLIFEGGIALPFCSSCGKEISEEQYSKNQKCSSCNQMDSYATEESEKPSRSFSLPFIFSGIILIITGMVLIFLDYDQRIGLTVLIVGIVDIVFSVVLYFISRKRQMSSQKD